jgi:predicted HAD superfamily Cof-like phosphohydrolase
MPDLISEVDHHESSALHSVADDDHNDSSRLVMPAVLSSVASFHRFFDAPVLDTPSLPSTSRIDLRISLIREEAQELDMAFQQKSLVDVADALCDLQYVIGGSVLELGYGKDFASLFYEYTSDHSFYEPLRVQDCC